MFPDIPGYREAVEREQALRDNAFVDLEPSICGVEVSPFNLRHWCILSSIESPFICNKNIEASDVAIFLWIVSTSYCSSTKKRDAFIKSIAKIEYSAALKGISKYLDDTFYDRLQGKGGSGSIAAFAAYAIHRIATAYGWPERETLAIPLKRLWQYLRIIKHETTSDNAFDNPSDQILAQWLRDINDGKKKLEDYVIRGNSSKTGAG